MALRLLDFPDRLRMRRPHGGERGLGTADALPHFLARDRSQAVADKLAAYKSMRDFAVTAEPSGAGRARPSERLRFVIQKHAATRLHYDFRLEYEGVMKSWAVTKGPSLDPHERRLAVEVEDHPLDYGDFEGTIPKGQYGGGSVMLWDRGYWTPKEGAVEAGLKKGHLSFELDGERLKGGWSLVRMDHGRRPGDGKRNNWLLIKHEDEAAREGDDDALLAQADTSVASGRGMEAIAAGRGKGPSPFITRKQGRKRAPAGPIPAFVEPQLTRIVDRPPTVAGWGHEIKFDGYRMQLRVADGAATLKTRKGLDWSRRFPEIVADGAKLPDCLIDGEAVAIDADGAPDFAALQAALSGGRTADLVFFVFDLLFDGGEDLRDLPLAERKARLKALVDGASSRIRYVDHFESGGDAVLSSACRMNLEGVVSKRLDAPYRSGRSEAWLKAKCRGGQEVVVAGWTSEDGKPFRSLIAGVQRDGELVHVGRIGTGFSSDKVAALLPALRKVETDASPFTGKGAPRGGPGVHWVRPVLVAEIESAGWTGDGHLRQASFKALREDKPAAEVVAETPAPVEAAVAARPADDAPKARAGAVVMGVTLSNPDKVLWPADKGEPAATKRDLALYYEAMAELILPHVRGRPCSIIRAPDGLGGQTFFQRHLGAGASALFASVEVSGDRKPYLQIDRPEALAAAAQTGALELHPWNCLPGRPDIPGRLVFDLDPGPGLTFDDVIRAAREVKGRLEEVGLAAFCKTTGGKGLHVVTPLAEDLKLTWPEAKAFARELCARMAADSPDRYLVNMAKAKREKKIFLDYLRNDRMATAVAPYSPRGRPGAPVSFPLAWGQVKAGLDPMSYTLRTAPALARKSKAWADYDAAARPLRDAIARLGDARAA
jgi:bifunctional non-homologous end joining protein LigD